jgi:glucose/arabinose dehydrogenase
MLSYGLRNPVGLDFHLITKELYVACQERDQLGDDLYLIILHVFNRMIFMDGHTLI